MIKGHWLFLLGIILNVVSISILLLLRFSAPNMGEKYYQDLSSMEQRVFWIAGGLMVVAIVCKAVYWGREWVKNK
jgi:hypothetical protein